MKFEMYHIYFRTTESFTDETAPAWLTGMVNHWFWNAHVLKLEVGQSIDTDFQVITRIE